MTCLIQSTALKDLTLLPLLPGYLLEQGEGLKVKGKASVQSDMKLHSKRSVDKKPRPISKSSLWSFSFSFIQRPSELSRKATLSSWSSQAADQA